MPASNAEANRRLTREYHQRYHRAPYGPGVRQQNHDRFKVIPADVTVLERDPAPCFRCGVASGPCRHREWNVG